MSAERYEIIKRIAVGGMAEIFLAKQRAVAGFERTVVVKRVLPELAMDHEFVAAFLDEARLNAKLTHPNIVQTIELGQMGDTYFIALEYVQGVDAGTLLAWHRHAGTQIPVNVACSIACDMLAGLDFAHHLTDDAGAPLGLVHRDISPSNVLVAYTGVAKVVDFGIAKATARVEGRTQAGLIKGKLGYLAPEQIQLKPIDKRVDVFTAGIVLYELLTAKHPFRAESDIATLAAITGTAPATVSELRPDVPLPLSQLVMTALHKSPDDRFLTAAEMQSAIERVATEVDIIISTVAVQTHLRDHRAELDGMLARRAAAIGHATPPLAPEALPEDGPSPVAGASAERGPDGATRPIFRGPADPAPRPRKRPRSLFVLATVAAVVLVAAALVFLPRDEPPEVVDARPVAPPTSLAASVPASTPAIAEPVPSHVAVIVDGKSGERLGFGLATSPRHVLTARAALRPAVDGWRVRCHGAGERSEGGRIAHSSDALGLTVLELDRDCVTPPALSWSNAIVIGETLHTVPLTTDLPSVGVKTTRVHLPQRDPENGPLLAIDGSSLALPSMLGAPVLNARNQVLGVLGRPRCDKSATACVSQVLVYPLVYADDLQGYSEIIRSEVKQWMKAADPLLH